MSVDILCSQILKPLVAASVTSAQTEDTLQSNDHLNLLISYLNINQGVFCKKAVLKNVAIFTGKQLCWSLFLIKL